LNANEHLRDLILSHQVGLNRLTNREVKRAVSILARIDRELDRIVRTDSLVLGTTTFRLERLLSEMQTVIAEAYDELHEYLRKRLPDMGAAEGEFAARLLNRAMPEPVKVALGAEASGLLSREFLTHLSQSRPFQGKLLGRWAQRLETNTRRAIAKAVRDGIKEGSSIQKVARLIRGTRATNFTNGILQRVTRQQAEAVVRTATQHVMQGARRKTFQNSRVVKGYQWLSTLDLRTTVDYCVPRDHLTWDLHFAPIGHGYTWGGGPGVIHFQCRSSSTAVLKSWQELGINAKELPRSSRASMDGQVAGGTTAEKWLKGQLGKPSRRSILEKTWGPERLSLFESGRLSIGDMVKRDGGLISLADLREIHGLG